MKYILILIQINQANIKYYISKEKSIELIGELQTLLPKMLLKYKN